MGTVLAEAPVGSMMTAATSFSSARVRAMLGVLVLGQDDLLAEVGGRDAGRAGERLFGQDVADDAVVPAVEVEGEADELVAAGVGAGEADGHHRRFGAGGVEADASGRRARAFGSSRPTPFRARGGAVVGAVGDLSGDGADERRVGVAEEEGAVAHDVIDDFVAVDVPFAGAEGVVDVDGEGGEVADVVGDAVREVALGLLVKGGGARVEGAVALEDCGHVSLRSGACVVVAVCAPSRWAMGVLGQL